MPRKRPSHVPKQASSTKKLRSHEEHKDEEANSAKLTVTPESKKKGNVGYSTDLAIKLTQIHDWLLTKPDQWVITFGILEVAAMMLEVDMVEVALPFGEGFIRKKYNPLNTGVWSLPPFRCDGSLKQGTLTKMFEKKYKELMENMSCEASAIPVWETLKTQWSQMLQFFFHIWCLHRGLDKEQAYAKAVELGESEVKTAGDLACVIKSLLDDKMMLYWGGKVKQFLVSGLKLHNPLPGLRVILYTER